MRAAIRRFVSGGLRCRLGRLSSRRRSIDPPEASPMGISDEEETIMAQLTRRTLLTTGSLAAAGALAGPWVRRAHAQGAPLKVGLVLPYTGVYAVLGESITQGMELVFARENCCLLYTSDAADERS